MSKKPIYEFDYMTASTNAVPVALKASVYFYDTGTTNESFAVLYDASDTYALWKGATEYYVTIVADMGNESATDKFVTSGGTLATLTGEGAFSGTLTANGNTIQESWNKAELEVFDSLIAFVGATKEVNAFRGKWPTYENGDPTRRNVWYITSGGSAGAYDADRTYGTDGNWCNAFIDASVVGIFRTRIMSMNFASTVLAWLKSNNNMKQTGNVGWCMLTDLPLTPESAIIGEEIWWQVTIPLQIYYLTEGEYS